ncbi:hypothetical protein LIER_20462 [Lithospermum erythrorhizon]|uniref:non-specific serine/threonine protein kinase n=1 Tax=Lithospermum erythrorhizon TaxID=34254 RepID=A0AAV3QMZ5_LITER
MRTLKACIHFASTILCVLNFLAICSSQSIDQDALLSFKNNLIPDSSNFLSQNWSARASVCSWIGITCGSNQRVTTLNLRSFGLKGTLSPHLGNLTFLKSLDISNNSLSGFIPSNVFNMSSLEVANVSGNSFSGSLPLERCGAIMKELYMDYNELSGPFPSYVLGCMNLEVLSMRDNKFLGNIPKEVSNMTALKRLNLANNMFIGELPVELASLQLEDLRIFGCNLTGPIPPAIFNISSLEVLLLARNNFSGYLPPDLGNGLPNLRMFFLSMNSLRGRIPSSIANASLLEQLGMSTNFLNGPIPSSLGSLKNLRQLVFGLNNLTAETVNGEMKFLTSLTNCRSLELLELSENNFKGTLPSSIGNFSDSLTIFNIFGAQVRGSIPSTIANLRNVHGIYLDSNELTGPIPASIGNMKQLDRIYLLHNKLEGGIPQSFCQLNNLWDLFLSDNNLSGPIPECLAEIKSLRRILLDSNRFNSSIPNNFWSLYDLVGLNLSSNLLVGSVPLEIKNLDQLRELGLSWNKFSGVIPSSISSFQSLVYLALDHNDFQGSIPQSWASSLSLEFLDLSSNKLTGKIPESLEDLRYLKYLNVSFNGLEGEIPTGGSFSNFTTSSFMNNFALCGEARFQVPQCEEVSKSKSSLKSSLIKYLLLPCASLAIFLLLIVGFLFLKRRKQKLSSSEEPSLSWNETSYQKILQATDSLSENNLLGRGSSGSVYKGIFPDDGLEIAVKVFHMQYAGGRTKSFNAECVVLSNVRHRNLVRIISSCSKTNFKALVLEYMPNGSLDKWLHSHYKKLNLLQRLNIAIDIAEALKYLHHDHMIQIVHCDIKPGNVLLDDDMVAHVCDFGIAKLFQKRGFIAQTKTLATIGYMAPEFGTEGIVSTRGDVYSYGITLLEMFTGKKPTSEMFGEGMSLKDWVYKSLHGNAILDVIDPQLFIGEDKYLTAMKQCIASIFYVAMDCLSNSSQERISMREVVTRLDKVKVIFQAFYLPKDM